MLKHGEEKVAKRWTKRQKLKNILQQSNHYEVSPRNNRFSNSIITEESIPSIILGAFKQ